MTQRWGDSNASLWFKVNGKPMYSKGNNWMPSSVLTANDASYVAMTVARLNDEVAIGGNTIRVWGGGIYETDEFYREADRLGLVILQDGSFFGSYPGEEDTGFTALVGAEIQYQARRLSPHVSLFLYSGNNESPDFANLPVSATFVLRLAGIFLMLPLLPGRARVARWRRSLPACLPWLASGPLALIMLCAAAVCGHAVGDHAERKHQRRPPAVLSERRLVNPPPAHAKEWLPMDSGALRDGW